MLNILIPPVAAVLGYVAKYYTGEVEWDKIVAIAQTILNDVTTPTTPQQAMEKATLKHYTKRLNKEADVLSKRH